MLIHYDESTQIFVMSLSVRCLFRVQTQEFYKDAHSFLVVLPYWSYTDIGLPCYIGFMQAEFVMDSESKSKVKNIDNKTQVHFFRLD